MNNEIDQAWLQNFDIAMKKMFAIDHVDAGLDNPGLARYADLPAKDAAIQFGEDYDLSLVDIGWC